MASCSKADAAADYADQVDAPESVATVEASLAGVRASIVKRGLMQLRTMVAESRPTRALFRTNHASNYLPLGGTLPDDRQRIVDTLDLALSGAIPLRPEWSRGL